MSRSRHSATGISLCLRSGRGVRGMSVSSAWTYCERNVCLSLVWRGAEEGCLYDVFGLAVVRTEYLCVFSLDVV
jgi:hypothetical protein